ASVSEFVRICTANSSFLPDQLGSVGVNSTLFAKTLQSFIPARTPRAALHRQGSGVIRRALRRAAVALGMPCRSPNDMRIDA
ncbi:MAG: hypothetical protein OXR03_09290, partial [Rhodospirillaceae bacterium]|nr:hypothetical protein [Rhodospirillaceae bacterium]